MSKLAAKIKAQFVGLLLVFAVALMVVAGAGVWGLGQTQASADMLYSDHLQTAQVTAAVAQDIDDAYETAQSLLLVGSATERARLVNRLFATEIPDVEASLRQLQQLHADDPSAERDHVQTLADGWAQFRALWTSDSLLAPSPDPTAVDQRLRAVFDQIEPITDELQQVEQRDAQVAHQRGDAAYRTSLFLIGGVTAVALITGIVLILILTRRLLPRSIAPEEEQAAFVDAMQLAANDQEAQTLLTRRLAQVAPGAGVVVLNHDAHSDRLTVMPVDSAELSAASSLRADPALREALDEATARSCAAIRTSRPHRASTDHDDLQPCQVCGPMPGTSLCTPLSVGGEIIGSVLVSRPQPLDADAERTVHDSIIAAAPILANLRNLAVARSQAATDALTGLPNKRTAADTLKRMVAQARLADSSLAVLSIDLDHFKAINDHYGHGRGDEVLAAVGVALHSAVRANDFPARTGGEEFLVVLAEASLGSALACADRIQAALRTIPVRTGEPAITASVGIAVRPDHAHDAVGLEQAADRALYAAKRNGRNRVEVADEGPPSPDGLQ